MAVVTSDDITVAWGSQPPSIEAQTGRWRTGVFQDVQESSDGRVLYFLYDPIADERTPQNGGYRRGNNCVVVFDLSLRCFTHEIPLHVPGQLKFLFALRPQTVGGDTRAVVVSQISSGGGSVQLHLTLVNLSTQQSTPITRPLDIARDFICTIREDAPELIVMANPGLQVWRLAMDVMAPTPPLEYFKVEGAQLRHFYDGFICGSVVVLVSAHPDGTLDYTRVHILDMQTRSLTTSACTADPRRGFPLARQQSAVVPVGGFIVVCGGETANGRGVQRLNDYWRLDLNSFQWNQCMGEMPVPLIEPRLTTSYGGHAYLWGDWDGHLPGIRRGVNHLRIIRVDGLDGEYEAPMPPPVGFEQVHHTPSAPPPYPDQPPPYHNQNPVYHEEVPEKKKKKKGCCTMQ